MKAGLIPVKADASTWTLQANAPRHREPAASRPELAAMLGLEIADLSPDPALWVDTGSDQLIIPLASVDAVRRASPKPELLLKHGSNGERALAYVWARDDAQPTPADGVQPVTSRFFFPKHGAIIEDPGTGSACANLGGWLLATRAALPQLGLAGPIRREAAFRQLREAGLGEAGCGPHDDRRAD